MTWKPQSLDPGLEGLEGAPLPPSLLLRLPRRRAGRLLPGRGATAAVSPLASLAALRTTFQVKTVSKRVPRALTAHGLGRGVAGRGAEP